MNENGEVLNKVHPFIKVKDIIGDSKQSRYISRYLEDLNVETYIIEDEYIDKDYLVDYSNFYARSFESHERFTKRLHFFSESISNAEFEKVLIDCDENVFKKIEDSYLGFVVIKPIKDSNRNPLVGRTILRTYPEYVKDEDEKRFHLTESHNVSLFGIPLKIESLPFQAQDPAVGACATAACWISSHPLNALFGTEKYSPFEITERSISFPHLERNFPSLGLDLYQIKTYYNSIGLETEFINVTKIQEIKEYTNDDDIVADAVKAYTKLGLPLIAALALKNEEDDVCGLHAAVISGYRSKHGTVKELYMHDDQIGPYSRTEPDGNFSAWKNEWTSNGYSTVAVETLVVPIYPKVRLSFGRIYYVFLEHKRKLEHLLESKVLPVKLTPVLYLMDVKQYKKFIWQHSCEGKEETLCKHLPRFLWIIRYNYDGMPIMDYVFDGTSVFPKKISVLEFKY